jgi:hypothetical protein
MSFKKLQLKKNSVHDNERKHETMSKKNKAGQEHGYCQRDSQSNLCKSWKIKKLLSEKIE